MKLSRPKTTTWWIAVVIGVAGLLGKIGVISILAPYAFWMVFIGFALLAFATLLKNL